MSKAHRLSFTCNICGAASTCDVEQIGRESASCSKCRSTVRMRSIVHTLSVELFGSCTPIEDFPTSPDLRGIGTSDWPGYANRLAKKLGYTNTFYHKKPHFDLTDPSGWEEGSLDFFISTDVFEHVLPPVERAFETVRRLLKPTGVFVFSVPYKLEGETVEHFPELHDWRIEKEGGKSVLLNRTKDGREQRFDDLVFHGGEGATLEMRLFSLPGIQDVAARTGFAPPRVYHQSHLACGTVWEVDWSLTMALRPARP
jgi:SAM-dependent methyltransferase